MRLFPIFLNIILLAVSSQALLCRGSASFHEEKRKKEIRIELYGGFSTLNGADLNQQSLYEKNYNEFFSDSQHSYYRSIYGDNYSYTREITGSFPEIKNASPLGVRIKYSITPIIALSIGFQYLSRTVVTDMNIQYQVRALRFDYLQFYDQYSDHRYFPDYTLSVRGYIPLMGLHLMTSQKRRFQMEGFLSGGPLFASCKFSSRREWRRIRFNGYWRGDDTALEIKGNGTGLAIETGARINIRLSKRFDFFLEGGYAYQVTGKINGTAYYQYQGLDANAAADVELYMWEGVWVLEEVYAERYWGTFHSYKPMVYHDGLGAEIDDFDLDLSGFRLKGGISYRF